MSTNKATMSSEKGFSFDTRDPRFRKFVFIELLVAIFFGFCVIFLSQLSTFKVRTTASSNDPPSSSNKFTKSSDIWFALGSVAAIDAFWVVATFNRTLIEHWHYFVSLPMMAIAYLISFVFYLSWQDSTASIFISQHPAATLLLSGAVYLLFGRILYQLHTPPPATEVNARFGSIQAYSDRLCRSPAGWKPALQATSWIGAASVLLIAAVPQSWATIVPLGAISFESIFLAFNRMGRGPEYTLSGGTFIQAVTFAHWGLPQVMDSPRLVIPPWFFLLLLVAGRGILDVHMYAFFYRYPEFVWARKQVLSTKRLVGMSIALLIIEFLGFPVVSYFKLIVVPVWYSISVLAVAAPASYGFAFDKVKGVWDVKTL